MIILVAKAFFEITLNKRVSSIARQIVKSFRIIVMYWPVILFTKIHIMLSKLEVLNSPHQNDWFKEYICIPYHIIGLGFYSGVDLFILYWVYEDYI